MRIQALARHAGVSFNGGPGLVHLRAANVDSRVLLTAWETVVVATGLGLPLRVTTRGDTVEGRAPAYPFLPLPLLTAALCAACEDRPLPSHLVDELAITATDARMYEASYGMHARAARRRGWVAQPLRLGFYFSLLVGAGRHARLLLMNLPPHVSATLALAGSNKAATRDLLMAHGLPVAPGSLASSPEAALRVARGLGGPVVLKRLVGGNSDGVVVGLEEARHITSATKLLLAGGHAVLVEAVVEGMELRLHFLAGRLHRAFHAEPFTVTGDGQQSLAALIGAQYPRYLRTMSASGNHRRRLVLCLWNHGVRTLADLDRVIPEDGRVVRISAASGAGMDRVKATDVMRAKDVARIERFLAHHGSPSCGVDLIVRASPAKDDEGFAILEVNVPCGFAYLDDPSRAVAADLDATIAGDPTFRRDKGRVPTWLVMEADARRLVKRAEAALRRRHGTVAVGRLDPATSNWIGLLNQPDADAMLIVVSETAILAHGIPANLAPVLLCEGDRRAFEREFPATCRTVVRAKGRISGAPRAR